MEFGPQSLFNVKIVRYVLLHSSAAQQHGSAVLRPVNERLNVVVENVLQDLGPQSTHLAQSI
jgi:hypothetical protein